MEEDLREEPEDDHPKREVIIIFAVFFEAGLAPLSLILGWLLGHPPLDRFAMEHARRRLGNRGHDSLDPDVSGHAAMAGRSPGCSRSSATWKSFRFSIKAPGRNWP